MKKLLIIGALFLLPVVASAQLTIPQGGTGTTTFPAGYLVTGNSALRLTAVPTTTASCSGSASCTSFTVIGSSPVTITSSGGSASSAFASSTAFTAGQVPYATNTNGTPITLGAVSTSTATISSGLTYSGTWGNELGGVSGNLTCTTGSATVFGCLTAANFNVFNNKIGTSSVITNGQVLVAGPNGNTAYSVATSTPTVTSPITYSGTLGSFVGGSSGAFACASCATFGYPFTYATTYNTLSAGTSTPLWIQGATYSLFASSTSIIDYASSTAHSVSGSLYIPQSASSTLPTTGQIAVQTGTASSSLQYQDGTRQAGLYNLTPSVVGIVNPAGSNATTTVLIPTGPRGRTLTQGYCQSSGGTGTGVIGNGTATTTFLISSLAGATPTITALSTNNDFDAFRTLQVQFGSWSQSTATTSISCTWSGYYRY